MSTGAGFLLSAKITGTTSACLLHPPQRSRGHLRLPPRVTCRQQGGEDGRGRQQPSLLLDRRDILIGLGGLYGAAAGPMAVAAPVMPPDLNCCHDANEEATPLEKHCCPPKKPPYTDAMIEDYDFPMTPLRVRQPAHLVKDDEDYMSKYKEAVAKMKALDEDHPWNYFRQAKIHCQFCNDAYQQGSSSGAHIQVHYSWLFLPWHRFYLHFYERILGKLIGDDTFTIPFWNFDAKDGMTFPRIFEEESSALYNTYRVKEGVLLDYKYSYDNKAGTGDTGSQLIQDNLSYMKKTFNQGLPLPELFMGDPLRGGESVDEKDGSSGQLEVIHNAAHMWVGQPDHKYKIDMGNFSTAARDSVFFSLHCNVDRLWDVYRNLRGNRIEFNDSDWLDSTFVFWDENMKLVNVKVKDCLNPLKLRYTYEQVPLPWRGKVSRPRTTETKVKSTTDLSLSRVGEFGTQRRKLEAETPLRVMVARPKTNRKKAEKEEKVEVLQIKGIEVATADSARFDVYVAVPYGDLAGPDFGEFAGSFVRLPHTMKGAMKSSVKSGRLKLGLNSLLEDIEAEDAEKLVVTLVLRSGDITVGGESTSNYCRLILPAWSKRCWFCESSHQADLATLLLSRLHSQWSITTYRKSYLSDQDFPNTWTMLCTC